MPWIRQNLFGRTDIYKKTFWLVGRLVFFYSTSTIVGLFNAKVSYLIFWPAGDSLSQDDLRVSVKVTYTLGLFISFRFGQNLKLVNS